jgi:hypothetical protein
MFPAVTAVNVCETIVAAFWLSESPGLSVAGLLQADSAIMSRLMIETNIFIAIFSDLKLGSFLFEHIGHAHIASTRKAANGFKRVHVDFTTTPYTPFGDIQRVRCDTRGVLRERRLG